MPRGEICRDEFRVTTSRIVRAFFAMATHMYVFNVKLAFWFYPLSYIHIYKPTCLTQNLPSPMSSLWASSLVATANRVS